MNLSTNLSNELHQQIYQQKIYQQRPRKRGCRRNSAPTPPCTATAPSTPKAPAWRAWSSLVQPQATWQALDVATGGGHMALAVASHVKAVVASDLTPQMLTVAAELARERGLGNVTVEPADAEKLPFNDDAFDLVTCRIAPHHFSNVRAFLREAARVLRVNGTLAVVDNIVPDDEAAAAYINAVEKRRDPSHGRALSLGEWEAAITAAGLRVTHVETMGKEMDFSRWCDNMNVEATVRADVRERIEGAPDEARDYWQPRVDNGSLTFRLIEGIFIARL